MSYGLCAKRAGFGSGSVGNLSRTDGGFQTRRGLLAGCALAIAALTLSAVPGLAGCNSGSSALNELLSSSNCQADARGAGATAVGRFANATYQGSTAFGHGAWATNQFTTVIGNNAGYSGVTGIGSIAIGVYAASRAAGALSVAIGTGLDVDLGAHAFGTFGVAIGGGDHPNRLGATASGHAPVAVGHRSVASGEGFASAFGYNARAEVGLAPTAVGTDSVAKGTNAAAFGRFSSALVEDSTAVGSGAQARKKGAVAIGFGSIADERNTVSVGSADLRRRIANVANAVNPTDAVTLRQVKQMIAAATTAATPLAAGPPAVSVVAVGRDQSGDDLRRRLSQLEALVRLQQERIAQLEGRTVAATSRVR